jgi:hypothetical protein
MLKQLLEKTAVSKHLKNAPIKILYLVTLLESLLGNSPNQEENLSRFQPNWTIQQLKQLTQLN